MQSTTTIITNPDRAGPLCRLKCAAAAVVLLATDPTLRRLAFALARWRRAVRLAGRA